MAEGFEMFEDQGEIGREIVRERRTPDLRHARAVGDERHPQFVEHLRPLVTDGVIEQKHPVNATFAAPLSVDRDVIAVRDSDHPEQQSLVGFGEHAFDTGEQIHVVGL